MHTSPITERIHNFNAGPAALPLEVLQHAQRDLLCDPYMGMSILEMSHRSARFQSIIDQARQSIIDLYHIPDTHEVLFLQGGASLQFAMLAWNLGPNGAYINTGTWSTRALAEANLMSNCQSVWSSQNQGFNHVPGAEEDFNNHQARYLHYTSNNTIYGTQFHHFPHSNLPLVCDMSSDFLSRPLDISRFDLIYAGAQKNAGPAGVSIVIIKKEISRALPYHENCPKILRYKTHADKGSLYHTPNTFGIYILSLMGQWLIDQGGLESIQQYNQIKASKLYDLIDAYPQLFVGHAHRESRSLMNITFNVGQEEEERTRLSALLADQLQHAQFQGYLGHRSVGGFRISLYNSIKLESVDALMKVLEEFAKEHSSTQF